MGWSIGYDPNWKRDIGYGVPALCDFPGCCVEIDRGLSHVCGGEPFGGDDGCGLYFCEEHLGWSPVGPCCDNCCLELPPFKAKPDIPRWIAHKLTDESWQRWRDENPYEVEAMHRTLGAA